MRLGPQAWEQLMADEFHLETSFERAHPYLRLLAQANLGERLRQKVDASDIVQQTLIQAHLDREQFRGDNEAQLIGWLKQIFR
jgi:RNA polymerase sigma-70 factor (ECF subfamily)